MLVSSILLLPIWLLVLKQWTLWSQVQNRQAVHQKVEWTYFHEMKRRSTSMTNRTFRQLFSFAPQCLWWYVIFLKLRGDKPSEFCPYLWWEWLIVIFCAVTIPPEYINCYVVLNNKFIFRWAASIFACKNVHCSSVSDKPFFKTHSARVSSNRVS